MVNSCNAEKLRLLQSPLSQTVQAGPQSQVVLACNAKGFPYPRYCWYRAFISGNTKKVELDNLENETDRCVCQMYLMVPFQNRLIWAFDNSVPPRACNLSANCCA